MRASQQWGDWTRRSRMLGPLCKRMRRRLNGPMPKDHAGRRIFRNSLSPISLDTGSSSPQQSPWPSWSPQRNMRTIPASSSKNKCIARQRSSSRYAANISRKYRYARLRSESQYGDMVTALSAPAAERFVTWCSNRYGFARAPHPGAQRKRGGRIRVSSAALLVTPPTLRFAQDGAPVHPCEPPLARSDPRRRSGIGGGGNRNSIWNRKSFI